MALLICYQIKRIDNVNLTNLRLLRLAFAEIMYRILLNLIIIILSSVIPSALRS